MALVPCSLVRPGTVLILCILLLGRRVIAQSYSGDRYPYTGPNPPLKEWEIDFYLQNYLPICGNSYEAEGAHYWSNCPECESAMAYFNKTSLSAMAYNTAGISNATIGRGTRACMCFTVKYTPSPGLAIDACLLVGETGEVLTKSGGSFGLSTVAVGLQNPQPKEAKALPLCGDISLPTPSGSASSASPGKSTGTSRSGSTPTGAQGGGSSGSGSGAGAGDGGLSTEAKIALGTGIPGAIVAIAVIIGFCLKCGRRGPRQSY